jgi:hypothetical protein
MPVITIPGDMNPAVDTLREVAGALGSFRDFKANRDDERFRRTVQNRQLEQADVRLEQTDRQLGQTDRRLGQADAAQASLQEWRDRNMDMALRSDAREQDLHLERMEQFENMGLQRDATLNQVMRNVSNLVGQLGEESAAMFRTMAGGLADGTAAALPDQAALEDLFGFGEYRLDLDTQKKSFMEDMAALSVKRQMKQQQAGGADGGGQADTGSSPAPPSPGADAVAGVGQPGQAINPGSAWSGGGVDAGGSPPPDAIMQIAEQFQGRIMSSQNPQEIRALRAAFDQQIQSALTREAHGEQRMARAPMMYQSAMAQVSSSDPGGMLGLAAEIEPVIESIVRTWVANPTNDWASEQEAHLDLNKRINDLVNSSLDNRLNAIRQMRELSSVVGDFGENVVSQAIQSIRRLTGGFGGGGGDGDGQAGPPQNSLEARLAALDPKTAERMRRRAETLVRDGMSQSQAARAVGEEFGVAEKVDPGI